MYIKDIKFDDYCLIISQLGSRFVCTAAVQQTR